MRSRPLAAAAALLALTALRAPAQTNAERVANDQYTRTHDYDLIHQRIEVGGFDWDSLAFHGRVTTTLVGRRAGLDSIVLDAGHLLRVRTVADRSGATLRSAAHGDTLVVFLRRPLAFGDSARFTIDYAGKVDNGRGLTFIQPEGRPHRPQQIWSQGEAMDNHLWFPTYDFPNDKMTWELIASVPAGYTAVSNGKLVSDTRARGGTRTMYWSQTTPSATYLVSLVVAPLVRIHDSWSGIPVDYYVYHDDSALARPLFRETPDMIATYSRLTGVRYPWAKYAQTTVADFFGGMENVSATTLVDWLPDARAYRDRPWYQYILIPHELAHQWFGDYVTTENWANTWLNEGFAEFMPGQYWEEKLGRHAGDDYYLDEYRSYIAIDHGRRMPLAAEGSNVIYPKGALVLRMLQQYLGKPAFWASLHRYLTEHAYGNATTDDLRQAVLEATGQNLDWFWDEWMYQAGYPEIDVAAAYDSGARALTLTIRQTQIDSAKPDSSGLRYTTPPVFRMPVAIRIAAGGRDTVVHAQLDARQQTVAVAGIDAPTMVVFDDSDAVLKKLTFDQPTAWLAEELRRTPDLWNRRWTVEQLARRTSDTLALAALARAATDADYYLTRADAAGALGAFPADRVLPVLGKAMRDTSSAVRSAAVSALASAGGAEATTLARQAWTSDPSYEVRASALLALARLDSAGRTALIAEGLRTPSYRSAIQNAAVSAAARLRDTSAIGALEGVLGDQQLPAYGLAALAAAGSDRALDVLVQHLDDPRPYVREWALAALVSRAGTGALERLRSVASTLKYPETRQAAERALQRANGRQP